METHSLHKTPPNGLPVVITKLKQAYTTWQATFRDMPKTERVGIGQKVDGAFLATLELTFTASYLPPHEKVVFLGKAISKLDVLKFFLQICWESKHISNIRFAELISLLEEVGRMLGGWRKGLLNKTPPA